MLLSDVRLKNYGSESVEVIDNGCGVDEGNFQALSMSEVIGDFMNIMVIVTDKN